MRFCRNEQERVKKFIQNVKNIFLNYALICIETDKISGLLDWIGLKERNRLDRNFTGSRRAFSAAAGHNKHKSFCMLPSCEERDGEHPARLMAYFLWDYQVLLVRDVL